MATPSKLHTVYAYLGQQILGIILASAISTFVATKTLDIRVTQLESQAKEVRQELKEIANSTRQMSIDIARLAEVAKREYERK